MAYTAKNIDVAKMEQGLKDKIRYQEDKIGKEILRQESYLCGYEDAIFDVIGMLHCSNYEKREAE